MKIKQHLMVLGIATFVALPLQTFASVKGEIGADKSVAPKLFKTDPPVTHVATDSTLNTIDLVADGFTTRDKMEAEKERLHESALREEKADRLNNPALELYGENSWGEHVNPFAGISSNVAIPEKWDINCEGFVMPIDGKVRVNSNYGYRRRFRRMHYGIDLHICTGDTIRAAFDGKVRISGYQGRGYGNYIVVRHDNGLETVYGHLSKKLVPRDAIVKAGQPIALGGSTGRSTGPHLHFETRVMGIPINPALIFDFQEGVPLQDVYTFHRSQANFKKAASPKQYVKRSKASAKTKKAPAVHRIRKGDTLSEIAAKHGISVTKLCKLNNISSRATLRPGRALRVR